jgi:dTDP-4-dehydrorhamnose 3,5-epimerase
MENTILYKGAVATDDRGSLSFVNDFNFKNVKRFYQVQNHSRGFIRAWHGHLKEGKYVYAAKGSFQVGVIHMPEDVKTVQAVLEDVQALLMSNITLKGEKFILSDKNPSILYIPAGCFNGFKSLTEDGILQFFSTSTLEESKGDDIRMPYDWFVGKTFWENEYR